MAKALSETPADEIPTYPMARDRGCPFDPPPELDHLRADAPISRVRIWDGSTPWLLTRFEDQRAALADPRFSADSELAGYPHISDSAQARRAEFRTFLTMDDPEHGRMRRMLTGDFAIKRMEALRPRIQHIADRLIDDMLAAPPPADLVECLGLPLPSLVICDLLGVPYADHEFFQQETHALVSRTAAPAVALAANDRLRDYLSDLISAKDAEPSDDMLSRLIVERMRTGEITHDELARMAMLLLIGGHETTANMISLGTLALLRNPEQLALLRRSEDPSFVAHAVEELLRYLTVVHHGRRRVALTDVEIGGQLIRAGEGVIVSYEVANRDSDVFADPRRLDIERDARSHVAFGFGIHQCLGQPLARVELQVVYGTLIRRIPTLRLATDIDSVPFKSDGLIYGVYELPVAW
jgi:hypothetical protein